MADAAWQQGEALGRPAVRDMVEAAVWVDADGLVREISAAFEALLGWAEGELIGLSLERLHASAPVRHYRHRAGYALRCETVSVPFRFGNGSLSGFLHILRDVPAQIRRADGLMDLIAFVASQKQQGGVDLEGLLDVGRRCFDLDVGMFFRQVDDDWCIEAVSGNATRSLAALAEASRPSSLLSTDDEVAAVEDAGAAGGHLQAFRRDTGIKAFLACAVRGADRRFGTLCLASPEPRDRPFDDRDRQILDFMAQWLATRLEAEETRRSCKEANRRFRKSEERHRMLYEKTPAMLHSIDDRGRLASVSDFWLAAFGYTREEVVGRPSTDFLTPESRRYAEDVVLPAYRAVGFCTDVVYQFVAKNGDIRDVLLSAISQTDENGKFSQSLAILLDVTERRRIERRLARKTEALQRSHADLARFAHIASHDLQEPLRRIIAYCDLLKEDHGPELSDDAAAIAGIIQSGGRRLRLMINDLLAYARVSEQLDRDAEPVDMAAVLSQALDDLAERIVSRDVRVDVPHLPLVWGRRSLLKTLFHHLLGNAIDHGGERTSAIEVSVEDAGEVWQFAVTDNGVGVEPRFGEKIFEIFQRLHLGDEFEGSGAGLAICRLIVQRDGGDIWLDSHYRDGARFLFTVPKEKPDYPGTDAMTSPAQPDVTDPITARSATHLPGLGHLPSDIGRCR